MNIMLKDLKSLRERQGVVTYQTDKSGRFSVDSMENYKEACKTHSINDITIDEEEHFKKR